jgi:hypothetical protein
MGASLCAPSDPGPFQELSLGDLGRVLWAVRSDDVLKGGVGDTFWETSPPT